MVMVTSKLAQQKKVDSSVAGHRLSATQGKNCENCSSMRSCFHRYFLDYGGGIRPHRKLSVDLPTFDSCILLFN